MIKNKKVLIIIILTMALIIYSQGLIKPKTDGTISCSPSWSCSSWSECQPNNVQTRTCNDLNHCSLEEGEPSTSQSCIYPSNGGAGDGTTISCPASYVTTSFFPWVCESSFSQCYNNFKTKGCCQAESRLINAVEYIYCQEPIHIKGSSYGKIKMYLASSPATGYDSTKLNTLAEQFKVKIKEASYGIIDNLEITTDPMNPDFTNPNIGVASLRSNYQIAYYFSDKYPEVSSMFAPPGLFSSASIGGIIPWGWTGPIDENFNDIVQPWGFWSSNLHETGHTMGCGDYDGNIMRPLPDLADSNHYPPICLEAIEEFMRGEAR